MPAYVISEIEVTNPEGYKDYIAQAGAIVARYGGRYLARGGLNEMLEDDSANLGAGKRVVIMEFPSEDAVRAWHNSAEYAPVKKIRHANAKSKLRLLGAAI